MQYQRDRDDLLSFAFFGAFPAYYKAIALILGFGSLILFGLTIQYIKQSRHDAVVRAFESGPDFAAIAVYENDPETSQSLINLFRSEIDEGRPVFSFKEATTNKAHRFFVIKPVDVSGLPAVEFVQSVPANYTDDGYAWSTLYTIFKGPNAFAKLTNWLKDHKYDSAEYTFRMSGPEYETEPFAPTRRYSRLGITAWFTVGWRTYAWDGLVIHDMSQGITGENHESNGDEQTALMVQALQKIGK